MSKKSYKGIEDIKIINNQLYFKYYPFEPAFISKNKQVTATQIEAIYLNTFPISLKISEDLIFISKTQSTKLEAFALKNAIPILQRNTNWIWLTEPFLDTDFSMIEQAKTLKQLEKNGFSPREVQHIRQEIEKPLLKYNSVFWEEYFLGLYDVLLAMQSVYNKKDFNEFYWKAIEIECQNK